jgi:hypothetical protein
MSGFYGILEDDEEVGCVSVKIVVHVCGSGPISSDRSTTKENTISSQYFNFSPSCALQPHMVSLEPHPRKEEASDDS